MILTLMHIQQYTLKIEISRFYCVGNTIFISFFYFKKVQLVDWNASQKKSLFLNEGSRLDFTNAQRGLSRCAKNKSIVGQRRGKCVITGWTS